MSISCVRPDEINSVFERLDKRDRVRLCNIMRQFDELKLWVLLYQMMHIKTDITLHHS